MRLHSNSGSHARLLNLQQRPDLIVGTVVRQRYDARLVKGGVMADEQKHLGACDRARDWVKSKVDSCCEALAFAWRRMKGFGLVLSCLLVMFFLGSVLVFHKTPDIDISFFIVKANNFLHSDIFSAAIGSMAGAGFGVWGAQRLAERRRNIHELMSNIERINAVSVIVFSIYNQAVILKKTSLEYEFNKYINSQVGYFSNLAGIRRAVGGLDVNSGLYISLVKYRDMPLLTKEVVDMVVSIRFSHSRFISLALAMHESFIRFCSVNSERSEVVDKYSSREDSWVKGGIDSLLINLYESNENMIFYSSQFLESSNRYVDLLVENLRSIGVELEDAVKPVKFDLSDSYREAVIPARDKYEPWLQAHGML